VIYEPELETLPRKQLRALQTEHLRALLAHVKERAPLYRERLADVEPGDIASVDDLGRLPFTRKDDLRESIGCSLSVACWHPGTVPRSEGGKFQRVLDRRTFA